MRRPKRMKKRKETWSDFTQDDIDEIIAEKCTYCGYRGVLGEKLCCDYIIHTGHSRGCRPDKCDKFKPGTRKKVLVQPSLSHKKRKVSVYESKRRHTSPARCYLGLMLDAYMHSHRLTQRDLAEMIGAKEDAVSRWRLGKRNPKTKTVRKIAEALGIEEERIRAEIEKGLLPDVTGSEGKEKEETKEALSEHYPEVGRLEEVLPVHASV